MSRKTMETVKVGIFAGITVLTAGLAMLTRRPSDLLLVGSLALMTGYFVWKRRVVLRECGEDSQRRSEPDVCCAKPNDAQRLTMNVVAASLGATGLALGWSVAHFDDYSHAFVAQHGGATAGAAIALAARCVAVISWASSLRRFGAYVVGGGRRAMWAAGSWAVVTAVGYGLLATRDALGVLVAFDALRALLGFGLGLALLVPRVRRELTSGNVTSTKGAA